MDNFSDIAEKKMHERANNYTNKVGRELYKQNPNKYKGYIRTDCSTYTTNVLSDVFKKQGNTAAAKKVRNLAKNGNDLAYYLVTTHKWQAIYVSSDAYHPYDGNSEHGNRYYNADKNCVYGRVPISYFAVNFNPTPSPYGPFMESGPDSYQETPFAKGLYSGLTRGHRRVETKQNLVGLNELKKIKFGIGVSSRDKHVWMFSYGRVYEAHWMKEGKDIYEDRPLIKWPWVDNIIVVPPDERSQLSQSAMRKCIGW